MAGYREFQTGEVLTAANVDDFLAKQAVQKYADAAARDAALGVTVGGGNALRQGMVAYLDDDDELLKYDGSAWATVGNAGIGSNVVSAALTGPFTANSPAATYTNITGLTVTITPSSATSKVLLIAQVVVSTRSTVGDTLNLRFGGGNATTYVGDAAGSRIQAVFGNVQANAEWAETTSSYPMMFLDSPETTSPVTYSVQYHIRSGTTMFVNRRENDPDGNQNTRAASSITAIEVSA